MLSEKPQSSLSISYNLFKSLTSPFCKRTHSSFGFRSFLPSSFSLVSLFCVINSFAFSLITTWIFPPLYLLMFIRFAFFLSFFFLIHYLLLPPKSFFWTTYLLFDSHINLIPTPSLSPWISLYEFCYLCLCFCLSARLSLSLFKINFQTACRPSPVVR